MSDVPKRDYHLAALERSVTALEQSTSLGQLVKRAGRLEREAAQALHDAVLSEISAFSESRNPLATDLVKGESGELTDAVMRLLKHEGIGALAFTTQSGYRRADQRFPLEAMLHAFRVGQKTIIGWLRTAIQSVESPAAPNPESLTAVTDFAIDFVNAVSTLFATAYLDRTRAIAESAGDRRAELLRVLLDGYDESDARVATILREAGFLDGRQGFCVGLAQPRNPGEMDNPARANRLADSLLECLTNICPRHVFGFRDNKVVFVLSDIRRISGYSHARTSLAARANEALTMIGPGIEIGISDEVISTSQITAALDQARLALSIADDRHRVIAFSDIPMRHFLVHLARRDLRHALPRWTASFLRTDQKGGGRLVTTLESYANNNMNVLKTAAALKIHPNTVYARFRRIEDLTGLDPRDFDPLSELLLISRCAD